MWLCLARPYQSVEAILCELRRGDRGDGLRAGSTLVPQKECGSFPFLTKASQEGKEEGVLKRLKE